MKISTKGRYALRMAVYLAKHQCDEYVSLKAIAESEDISKKYLEQIVPSLCKAGYLKASRGFQGGYMLARKPADYTVREILELTEGSLAPVACLENEPVSCDRSPVCPTLPLWCCLFPLHTPSFSENRCY